MRYREVLFGSIRKKNMKKKIIIKVDKQRSIMIRISKKNL